VTQRIVPGAGTADALMNVHEMMRTSGTPAAQYGA